LVPTPSSYSLELSLATQPVNGAQRMVYTARTETRQLFRLGFDAARGVVTGAPQQLTPANHQAICPEISPDGQWLAYYSLGDPEFNLYVSRADGREPRRLTHETYKDRAPRWLPDGQRLVFYSDRTGKYEIWTVRPDGGELRQLSFSAPDQPGFFQPIGSPDNRWLAISRRGGGESYLVNPQQPWQAQPLRKLPPATVPGAWFMPYHWSFDSQKLAGIFRNQLDELPGLVVFDLPTQRYQQISASGSMPFWLRDNRRLLCTHKQTLQLVDGQTGTTRELYARPYLNLEYPVLSPDEKWLYYCASSLNEDIWLITL
jgi:Tol biopolymer transport system component